MSVKAFAVAAAAALPVAVSADKTITQSLFMPGNCTTPVAGVEPMIYPADGSCVDTTTDAQGQTITQSTQYVCDGTSVTATHFPSVTNCSVEGVATTSSLGECIQFDTGLGLTVGITLSGCESADGNTTTTTTTTTTTDDGAASGSNSFVWLAAAAAAIASGIL